MNYFTLTDADHGGLIEVRAEDVALQNALKLDYARAQRNQIEEAAKRAAKAAANTYARRKTDGVL